jgi:Glycosyltransferase (GlcNAc)/2OG-Fe(II) oxygenase superfamily
MDDQVMNNNSTSPSVAAAAATTAVSVEDETDSKTTTTIMKVLSGWEYSFTKRLLCSENIYENVVILDHAMSDTKYPADMSATIAAAPSNNNFCQNLWNELHESKLLDRLQPAKTTGERQSEALMELLAQQGAIASPSPSSPSNNNTVRGDKSIFVSKDYRQGPHRMEFQQRHQLLHTLISTVSATMQEQVQLFNEQQQHLSSEGSCHFHLDLSNTSVQVATYPGDGISGYARHCDRGQDSCKKETTTKEEGGGRYHDASAASTPTASSSSQRLFTAIYYLVDEDWDADLDGGALRVFQNGNSKSGDSFTDIVPRQDRLVVFRSDRVEHQVLPSFRRPRTAITIWFYGTTTIKVSHPAQASTTTPVNKPMKELPPPLPVAVSDSGTEKKTIFVSIASYRDSETIPTLDDLFATARHPDRIICGLVLQLEDGHSYDEKIWQDLQSFPLKEQVRFIRLHAKDAMGPCYARGLAQTLWRGEDYVLQIDSHMRLRPHWDDYLIQQCQQIVSQTGNPKVMLTTYPLGYTLPNNIPKDNISGTYLVPWKFDEQGMLRQRGRVLVTNKDDQTFKTLPPRHFLFAGGFNFALSRAILDVPYDTMGLPHLFFGEELSSKCRLVFVVLLSMRHKTHSSSLVNCHVPGLSGGPIIHSRIRFVRPERSRLLSFVESRSSTRCHSQTRRSGTSSRESRSAEQDHANADGGRLLCRNPIWIGNGEDGSTICGTAQCRFWHKDSVTWL